MRFLVWLLHRAWTRPRQLRGATQNTRTRPSISCNFYPYSLGSMIVVMMKQSPATYYGGALLLLRNANIMIQTYPPTIRAGYYQPVGTVQCSQSTFHSHKIGVVVLLTRLAWTASTDPGTPQCMDTQNTFIRSYQACPGAATSPVLDSTANCRQVGVYDIIFTRTQSDGVWIWNVTNLFRFIPRHYWCEKFRLYIIMYWNKTMNLAGQSSYLVYGEDERTNSLAGVAAFSAIQTSKMKTSH